LVAREAGAILRCPISGNDAVQSGSAESVELAVKLGKAIHDACYEFEGLKDMEKTIRLTAHTPYTSCLTCTKCPTPAKGDDTQTVPENGVITPEKPMCFRKDGDIALDSEKKCVHCRKTPAELLKDGGCLFDVMNKEEPK
jgi:hypothetical protein